MNHIDISVTIAVIMDGLLGIAYLGYSAYLLGFKELPYTVCAVILFFYAFTSYGNLTNSLGSVFHACIDKKNA